MKIQINIPLVINGPVEVEFDNFVKVEVGMKGELESNRFLLSLWNEFDEQYAPQKSPERCPWAYFPSRHLGKKCSVICFGGLQTKIGDILVAISFRTKGDIDAIHFGILRPNNEKLTEIFTGLVSSAKLKMNAVDIYIVKAKLINKVVDSLFYSYGDGRFRIYNENKCNYISFIVLAINKDEAKGEAVSRLNYLRAFLSVETNFLFGYDEVEISNNNVVLPIWEESPYQEDFIDSYSEKDGFILISKKAVSFLGKYLFGRRELLFSDAIKYFLLGCRHFYEGRVAESKLEEAVVASSKHQTFYLTLNDLRDKEAIINATITSYLSSIETATFVNGINMTCPKCNAVQYKIAQRIADFVSRFFSEDMGKLFKKIYGFRSKYLHVGFSSTSNNYNHNKPLLDVNTGTGAIDYGFHTVRVDGGVVGLSTSNVREWTSYCLRKYYQKELLP